MMSANLVLSTLPVIRVSLTITGLTFQTGQVLICSVETSQTSKVQTRIVCLFKGLLASLQDVADKKDGPTGSPFLCDSCWRSLWLVEIEPCRLLSSLWNQIWIRLLWAGKCGLLSVYYLRFTKGCIFQKRQFEITMPMLFPAHTATHQRPAHAPPRAISTT